MPTETEIVEHLILSCLMRDPESRPSSMDEVLGLVSRIKAWDPGDHPYRVCKKHSYSHSLDFGKEDCPICRSEADFESRESQLEEILRG